MKDEPRDVRFINYAGPGTYSIVTAVGPNAAGDGDGNLVSVCDSLPGPIYLKVRATP